MKKRTPMVWMAALLGTALLVLLCTDKPEMGFDSTPPAANEEVLLCTDKPEMGFDSTPPAANEEVILNERTVREEVMSDGLRDSTAAANQGSNVIGFRKEVMLSVWASAGTGDDGTNANVTGFLKEVMPDGARIQRANATTPPVVVDQLGAKDNSDHIVGVNNMVQQPTMTMEATAYSYGCGTGDGLTATGIPVGEGVVAVDPNVIPYGSEVEIVGIGTFQAEDTGGAIRGNRIDIFMSDRGDCIRFGRQEVEVRILDQ